MVAKSKKGLEDYLLVARLRSRTCRKMYYSYQFARERRRYGITNSVPPLSLLLFFVVFLSILCFSSYMELSRMMESNKETLWFSIRIFPFIGILVMYVALLVYGWWHGTSMEPRPVYRHQVCAADPQWTLIVLLLLVILMVYYQPLFRPDWLIWRICV